MAEPQLLQDNFVRMVQDLPRDQLPEDAAWYMRDFIPNLGLGAADPSSGGAYPGRLSRRGGWLYASDPAMAGSLEITGMAFFDRPNKLCIMTDNNKFGYTTPNLADTTTVTTVSSAGVQSLGPWAELQGKLVIPAYPYAAPKYYDGTTFGSLAGSPPSALYTCTWKDRIVLGSTSAKPNRIYWSSIDDATSVSSTLGHWDTDNAWNDMSFDISGGMAALPNALLIFGSDLTARIRGSIPPPGSDFIVDDPIFHVGCHFPKTVAVNGSICCFANEEGVWLTNATSQPQDLTAMCGVKNAWQLRAARRMGGFSVADGVDNVCGGFIGNYYLLTLTRLQSGTQDAFLFDLANRSCVLLDNFGASCVAGTPQVGDELYFGIGTRIVATSPIFRSGGEKQDDDGTAIEPILFTRYYGDNRTNLKRWKTAYLDYYLRDAAADNPTLNFYFDTREYGNELISSHEFARTLMETDSGEPATRAKIPIRKASRGLSFTITQDNASEATNIVALLADVYAREGGRV